jgi:histidine ammonia-lyase
MAEKYLPITNENLTCEQIETFISSNQKIKLNDDVKKKIQHARQVIEEILKSDQSVYGVNTGFGKFSEVRINNEKVEELQKRLVYSHAAGTGNPIDPDIVRLIILLKIKSLALGHSGCRLQIVDMLIKMLNHSIIPVIPEKGSVGASGDLAPLAHMALVMMGKGSAFIKSKNSKIKTGWSEVPGKEALAKYKLKPISLKAKEGLALLNGTQVSTAIGVWTYLKAKNLIKAGDIIAAITVEALLGTLAPFDARIQRLRSHPGQKSVSANIRKILAGSPVVSSHKYDDDRVQDAYSLRCIPQVHGAVRDALKYVHNVLLTELNSVTDNPLIFPDKNEVISGGNFHAAPVGYACDLMGIVLTDMSNISERRIEHMQDPNVSLLPGFLTRSGGLNSGFMIAHVTSAALTSENKVLAHPASVDSIPTSANKEDHVSMATFAARKALEITHNLEDILAIELISACQALDLRAPLTPSECTGAALELVRSHIPFWKNDREIYKDMKLAKDLIASGTLVASVENICGPLQ